ncbi:DUF5675 family protein [Hymenobacter sp. H14-R3]|uniref:DUF5675 family protein n=1 Tax=Hymenobacter sp. H14-R3 TaxID=3046308 RepID=UPI0024B8CBE0|nr:DUF5675 family protein [Hymenobacter sp. H14-R3]MDJ0367373.1 DUF5675 family protein [Hymenobacter sp. H14-R3]
MVISIIRKPSEKGCTLSAWYVDGAPFCVGMEDVVRGQGQPKIFGQTAIPAGTYQVHFSLSTRFKRVLPLLSDMPGKQTFFGGRLIGLCGIRIHPGNYATDTEGCLLPGLAIAAGGTMVTSSRLAFDRLFQRMQNAITAGEPITLTIR